MVTKILPTILIATRPPPPPLPHRPHPHPQPQPTPTPTPHRHRRHRQRQRQRLDGTSLRASHFCQYDESFYLYCPWVMYVGTALNVMVCLMFIGVHIDLGDNWSAVPEVLTEHKLVTTGLFGFGELRKFGPNKPTAHRIGPTFPLRVGSLVLWTTGPTTSPP